MKAFRCICFTCQSYCIPTKGQCNMCLGTNLVRVGTNFRPPSKTQDTAWKKLFKVFCAQNAQYKTTRQATIARMKDAGVKTAQQIKDFENLMATPNLTFLRGFGGSGHWSPKRYNQPGLPKKRREIGYLEYLTPKVSQ